MVGSKRFATATLASDAGEGGTMRKADAAEKALRSACQNQMVVAALFYSDLMNKWVLRMIVRCSRPIMEWHERQQKALRTVEDSSEWMLQEMSGGLMRNSAAVLAVLVNEEALRFIGLSLPKAGHAGSSLDDLEAHQQQELANTMGRLTLELVCHPVAATVVIVARLATPG